MARLRDSTRSLVAAAVLSFVFAVGALAGAIRATDGMDLQFAGTESALEGALVEARDGFLAHIAWDFVFLAMLAGFVVALVLVAVVRRRHAGRIPRASWWLLFTPMLLDLVENGLLMYAYNVGDKAWLAPHVETVASLKWIGYAALAPVLVSIIALWWLAPSKQPPLDPPPGVAELHERWKRQTGRRRGIALSGGGIRSAAFSLGGLHALGNDVVRGSAHLSAASGGAYLAAAMTHRARSVTPPDELPFAPGSPELERLRARSSWLALGGAELRIAAFRAFAAIAFNLMVLWLVAFALLRPVGWLLSTEGLHPELRARTPLIEDAKLERDLTERDLQVDAPPTCDLSEGCRFDIVVRERDVEPALEIETKVAEAIDRPHDKHTFSVEWKDGVVLVEGAAATVEVQPRAAVELEESDELLLADSRDPTTDPPPLIEVTRQPEVAIAENSTIAPGTPAAIAERLAEVLEVEAQPRIEQRTGYRGRDDIEIDGWMIGVPVVLLVVAVSLTVLARRQRTTELRWWMSVPFALACVTAIVLIVLPLLLQWLPTGAYSLISWIPGVPDVAPGEPIGFGLWLSALIAAGQSVRSLLKRGQPKSTGGQLSKLVLKTVVLVLLSGAGVGLALAVLQQGALNGPQGRLSGFGAIWWMPFLDEVPDIARWALAVVALGALAALVSAHHWSFQPLYRDRLAEAFSLTDKAVIDARGRREFERAEFPPPTPTWTPQPVSTQPIAAGGMLVEGSADRVPPQWPELIICAAVNLNDTDVSSKVPAARWAGSFVFTNDLIGGPDVGYIDRATYERRLRPHLRRDLDLPSVVAISGAAFSPAMGKFGYGAIGGLFAVINLRLGMWLPHPAWVHQATDDGRWRRRPSWPYLLREVFGWYRRKAAHLYVTDGGHWDNLGLVELFRRRCDEIVVISAAGDGAQSFATVAEAFALAREQCGVEIDIDLSPMRPPADDPPKPPARQLLRRGASGKTEPATMAPQGYAVGTFRYREPERKGRILVVESTLTDDLPWDVHAWAESETVFPDDPTTDQFFNHRQLESYRRLGQHHVDAGWRSEEWRAAGLWVDGTIDDDGLQRLLGS